MIKVDKQVPSPNFTKGRGGFKPEAIVVHIMEGTLAGTDSWFSTKASKVSAHFGIGQKGVLHQYVDVADTAWHAGRVDKPTWIGLKAAGGGKYYNPNRYTIGIEHEGLGNTPWSGAMYHKSAELIAHLCIDYHIPLERSHIVGHHEIYSVKSCPGHYVKFITLIDLAKQYRDAIFSGGAVSKPNNNPLPVQTLDLVNSNGSVTTFKNLNIRLKRPSTLAAIVKTVPAGSTLTYIGYVDNGQPINGNRKWFVDSMGDYFWSGATV